MSHHFLVFPIRTLTLTGLLVAGLLAPPALAHSDGGLRPPLDATTPAWPANGPATERASAGGASAATQSQASPPAASQPERLALASELPAATTLSRRAAAPDQTSRAVDLPVVPAGLPATAAEAGYVDPAGGHPRIRPIETHNPYRARSSRR